MLVMKPLIVFKNSIKGWQITKFSVSFLTCGLPLQVPRAVFKRINKQRSGEKDNLHSYCKHKQVVVSFFAVVFLFGITAMALAQG